MRVNHPWLKEAQAHENVHLSKKAQDLLAATDVTGSPQLPHTHLFLGSRVHTASTSGVMASSVEAEQTTEFLNQCHG